MLERSLCMWNHFYVDQFTHTNNLSIIANAALKCKFLIPCTAFPTKLLYKNTKINIFLIDY